jgi:hypothetical protein
MRHTERILQLAQENANSYDIFDARRAGSGDQYTKEVVDHLKFLVIEELGPGVVNQFLSKENRQSVDFWLEDEHTIIAMEFNMFGSTPLIEKEAFKALLAKDAGKDVRHLLLIGDPGSVRRHHVPTTRSIIAWVERQHQIRVRIWELKENDKFTGAATAEQRGDVRNED